MLYFDSHFLISPTLAMSLVTHFKEEKNQEKM